MLALLAFPAPAHAAFVSALDANLDLNSGSSTQLTGEIDLRWSPTPTWPNKFGVNDYYITYSNLSLNGVPIVNTGIPPNALSDDGRTVAIFGGPDFLAVFGLNTNYLPPDPTFSDFVLGGLGGGTTATGGTVTVLSETLATPLPPALPLFGSALLALAGFAAWSRRSARG